MRVRLSSTCFPKKLMHCAHSRFPLIYSVSSGYGRRTSGHGAGSISCRIKRQRLSSIRLKTTEIPTSTKRSGGMHHSGSISPYRLKRGMKPDKPVKSPVWQTHEDEISFGKYGVHARRKYWIKRLHFKLDGFPQALTLQFRGLTAALFLGGYFKSWSTTLASRLPLWASYIYKFIILWPFQVHLSKHIIGTRAD